MQHATWALQGISSSLALLEAGCLRGPSLRPAVTAAALEEVITAARCRLAVERAVEQLLGPPEGPQQARGPVTRAFASAVRAVLLAIADEAMQLEAAVIAARHRSAMAIDANPLLGGGSSSGFLSERAPPTLLELLQCSQGLRGRLLVLETLCGCDTVKTAEGGAWGCMHMLQ